MTAGGGEGVVVALNISMQISRRFLKSVGRKVGQSTSK